MNRTVKSYFQWIFETNDNLMQYDFYFNEGKKSRNNDLGLSPNVHDYAFFYISQYLIINLYEFLNLIHRWKFEQEKDEYELDDVKFGRKMKDKFEIEISEQENISLINKIAESTIFKPWHSEFGPTLYDYIHKARQEIAHAYFGNGSKMRIDGINRLKDVLDLLKEITGISEK